MPIDIVTPLNKVFREHRRYTGDGLPGEPASAPLPIGDPASGVHVPEKAGIRAAFAELQAVLEDLTLASDEALQTFRVSYVPPAATDPTTDGNGDPLTAGAIYFNTAIDTWKYYDGAAWQVFPFATVADGALTFIKIASAALASQAEAEAGSSNAKLMTPLRVAQAIASLVPASTDGLSQFGSLVLAIAFAESGRTVATGESFADGFASLGMVDVAGATNLDSSEASLLKTTLSYSADLTTTGFSIANGEFSTSPSHDKGNPFDNAAVSVWISAEVSTGVSGVSWIGQDFGSGNAKHIRQFSIAQNFGANQSVTSIRFQWSDNGTTWNTVGTYTVAYHASNVFTFALPTTAAHRYWRVLANSNIADPTVGWCVNEITMSEAAGAATLTVASQILPVAFVPSQIKVVGRVIPTDALTLNTDLIIDVSRDAGTTWTSVVLGLAFNDGSTSVLESPFLSVAAQPSGSSPRWRVRSANSKAFSVDGIALAFRA